MKSRGPRVDQPPLHSRVGRAGAFFFRSGYENKKNDNNTSPRCFGLPAALCVSRGFGGRGFVMIYISIYDTHQMDFYSLLGIIL